MLEPTPETLKALRMLEEQGDYAVALSLDACATRASAIVPDLVGLSLAFLGSEPATGLTFTMTSGVSDRDSSNTDSSSNTDPAANLTRPVRSSLALALMHPGRMDGTISLFSSSPTAFQGREDHFAEALGSDLDAANTPLSRDNHPEPDKGPELVAQRIREHDRIDQAVGFIASANDTDVEAAEEVLRRTAADAGQSEIQTAESVLRRPTY